MWTMLFFLLLRVHINLDGAEKVQDLLTVVEHFARMG